MFNIYDHSLDIYQKNIRARVPLIMALFSGKGGRFILYRPGQEPLEAPPVPPILPGGEIRWALRHGHVCLCRSLHCEF